MTYAIIVDGLVSNLVEIHELNAHDFPNAVSIGEYPVDIGDSYIDGVFYRDNERLKTLVEAIELTLKEKDQTIEELDNVLLDMMYNNILEGLE